MGRFGRKAMAAGWSDASGVHEAMLVQRLHLLSGFDLGCGTDAMQGKD